MTENNQSQTLNADSNPIQNGAQSESSASQYKVDDPLYLHASDNSSLVLVSDLLTELNYMSWSRLMMIALEAKDKLRFINGTPLPHELTHKHWRKVNSTLISWIMNSVSKEIGRGCMFANNVKDLWDEIKEGCNGPRMYELRRNIYVIRQGGDYIHVFYNKLKEILG
ncbi:hypothetical protein LIER_12181 [Lithospermum erythrorhizon]|uniref:Retrotransposon Copia-like N-terminal domain-containing protein n=1 Tax=Lithospermum erythrorhizon TaxID=34254 RepID=A0AAV3PUT9_LITER